MAYREGKNAVVETNQVAAVQTGRMKAQYPVEGGADLQNGMLVVIDEAAKLIKLPGAAYTGKFALHASEERIYEGHLGRDSFILKGGTQIPRVFYLEDGDIFETDAVVLDGTVGYYDAAFGVANADGLIAFTNDVVGATPHKMYLEVVEKVTLPNGKGGFKFAVKTA